MKEHKGNSYHDEIIHKNEQKAVVDDMEKAGNYDREEKNVLKKDNVETKFTVRLHFKDEDDVNDHISAIEEVQKLLTETYIRNLSRSGD